jgi:Adenine specific DNA methylase Mod
VANRLEGKVELTWTNKHQRLITHEDPAAKPPYAWVRPSDFRVAETRLLTEVARVGDASTGNLLLRGDALHALTALARGTRDLPSLARQVRVAYIDPPFNTGKTFEQYEDNLEHSIWLTMMRDRMSQIYALLSDDGSVWVHCDDSEQSYLRILLDELFLRENFVATVIWQKTPTRENRTVISTSQDYIHVYAKNKKVWSTRRNLIPFGDEQYARFENPDNDPRGPWASLPIHAKAGPGRRKEQFYTITTSAGRQVDPPKGRCWLFVRERYDEMVADNRIYFGADGGNVPRQKKFLSEKKNEGLVPTTLWLADEVGATQTGKDEMLALFPDRQPFATPKPEALIARVIQIASDPDDLVLDCFGGSGTTAAVAHKVGRRWATVEISADTIENYTMTRCRSRCSSSASPTT